MLKRLVFLLAIATVSGQTWVTKAHLNGYFDYWLEVTQGLVNELERREWCNLKLHDITQTINNTLYHFHVAGTAKYTNGFVVSIQKIDVQEIKELILSRTIAGEAVPFGTVQGILNFRDVVIGHDVVAEMINPPGTYRSTGTFLHNLVQFNLDITQNLITKEITVRSDINRVTNEVTGVRMQYFPSSNVTEALSRQFWSSTFSSASDWATNIFAPIVLNITRTLEFPKVCFSQCNS